MKRKAALFIVLFVLLCSTARHSRGQTLTKHPSGVITGRVVDDAGRPMRGLDVKALALTSENGKPRLLASGNRASTNDRGEFRVFWLDPGKYDIVVSLPQIAGS